MSAEQSMTIGERIRLRRVSSGLTQQVLSERTGVAVTRISSYENDTFTPSVETLQRLARALGPFTIFAKPIESTE
jgi:transcriptional regulator with XRE-family HTH domain